MDFKEAIGSALADTYIHRYDKKRDIGIFLGGLGLSTCELGIGGGYTALTVVGLINVSFSIGLVADSYEDKNREFEQGIEEILQIDSRGDTDYNDY